MYEYTITISLTLTLPDNPTFEDISRAVEGDPDNARYKIFENSTENTKVGRAETPNPYYRNKSECSPTAEA